MGRHRYRSPSSTISSRSSSSTISSLCNRLNNPLLSPRSGTSTSSVRTSKISLRSSKHGRLRRSQRALSKYELRKVMKHGQRVALGGGRAKFTHDGVVVVIDVRTSTEITSYKSTVDIPYKFVSSGERQNHDKARKLNQEKPDLCRSHSVLLVDTSGSMRTSDVQGCRSRMAAVFLAIAEDFIRPRIEAGGAEAQDALSIILMGEQPWLWMCAWPTDYITYNVILKAFKEGHVEARGHCCYLPALEMARSLFSKYDFASCRLVLGLFTDGRPSDFSVLKTSWSGAVESITASAESIASKIGNRLAVKAIGMGSASQWQTLEEICRVCRNYGCEASVSTPSMSSSGLGAVVSSIATSLSESQLLNTGSKHVKRIQPVQREDRSRIPLLTEVVDSNNFHIYMFDKVVREELVTSNAFMKVTLQHHSARGVAIRKQPFDEGSERFAYQFFEVAEDGVTIVGAPLVAKACKFVRDENDSPEEYTHKFVTRFCRMQKIASKIATSYNERLNSILHLDKSTPRVEFLPCSVYRLFSDNGQTSVYIVEPRLFGRFSKWNSNNGWIRESKPSPAKPSPVRSSESLGLGLAPIKEEEDPDMDSVDARRNEAKTAIQHVVDLTMSDNEDEANSLFVCGDDVAQAFSHFSYVFERRRILVCDLQGVYDRQQRLLRFTDPVIHYFNRATECSGKYGRTDRGGKGISDFLETHKCNCLCSIVTKGFLPVSSTSFSK